jgi:antitoxin component of MazEF toxin-antitoxin module
MDIELKKWGNSLGFRIPKDVLDFVESEPLGKEMI